MKLSNDTGKLVSKNFLEMMPVVNFPYVRTDDSLIRIEVPKFKNPVGIGFCRLLKLGEKIGIKLDKIGSFIYERCDGSKTVGTIISEARHKFGEDIEPAIPRVREFFRALERNKLIAFDVEKAGAE